jgi:mRNA interferase MazF
MTSAQPPGSQGHVRVDRFDVYLVNLDPTTGSEIRKTRPALVVSPDEINHNIATVIIAPMTTGGKLYPTRVECEFEGKQGKIVLDQIRTIDKSRLVKKMGRITDATIQAAVLRVLAEMFAP